MEENIIGWDLYQVKSLTKDDMQLVPVSNRYADRVCQYFFQGRKSFDSEVRDVREQYGGDDLVRRLKERMEIGW